MKPKKITQMDTYKSVRKPMPPPTKPFKNKKKKDKWFDKNEIQDLRDCC